MKYLLHSVSIIALNDDLSLPALVKTSKEKSFKRLKNVSISYFILILHHSYCLCFILQAFGCIDQDRDGVIKKQDLKETYVQLGIFL